MTLEELDGAFMDEDLVLAFGETVAFALEREVLDGAPQSAESLDHLI
jgi:hypothetical protein